MLSNRIGNSTSHPYGPIRFTSAEVYPGPIYLSHFYSSPYLLLVHLVGGCHTRHSSLRGSGYYAPCHSRTLRRMCVAMHTLLLSIRATWTRKRGNGQYVYLKSVRTYADMKLYYLTCNWKQYIERIYYWSVLTRRAAKCSRYLIKYRCSN